MNTKPSGTASSISGDTVLLVRLKPYHRLIKVAASVSAIVSIVQLPGGESGLLRANLIGEIAFIDFLTGATT